MAGGWRVTRPRLDAHMSRGPSPFILFSQEQRGKLKAENADRSFGELSRLCGAAWREMPGNEKDAWKMKAQAMPARPVVAKTPTAYSQFKASYRGDPPVRAAWLSLPASEKRGWKPEGSRGPTAYQLFSRSWRASHKAASIAEASKQCGAAWRALDQEARAGWKAQAE